jgi:hypothetical protein
MTWQTLNWTDRHFKVKLLNPLYPIDKERMLDKSFITKKAEQEEWDFNKAKLAEKKLQQNIKPILSEFLYSTNLEKEHVKRRVNGDKLKDFDLNYEYINNCFFNNEDVEPD